MKKFLLLFLLFLSPFALLAKTTLTYNVVVYVEQKTADYFGGNLAMEDSIKGQLAKVGNHLSVQANINNNYVFNAVSFTYYNDNANDDVTMAYHQAAPEANNQYRMVYNAFPQKMSGGNYVNAYKIVFEIGYQSVLFSYRESESDNGSMFGRVMNNTITHEFAHSRGAWDVYAGNVDASQNLAAPTQGWKNPTPSLMNSLFTDQNMDKHSAYMINRAAVLYPTATFTEVQRASITNGAFPNTISVKVLNSAGTAQSNATVKLYGINWYGSAISATPTYTYTTDASGNVNWVGAANNPFNVNTGGGIPVYNTFFVSATSGGVTKYAWMPIFEVCNAFIDGGTSYTKTISLGSANVSPYVNIGNSGNLINFNTNDFSIPIFAYDLDGTITSVKLYDNGVYFADATFDGSNIYWFLHYASLSVGRHVFTAVATDNSGATTTSGALLVEDIALNQINVSLTSPSASTTFTAPASVPFKAYASEGGGTISKVEYYNGATLIGTSTVKPYTFSWTNVAAGTYSVTAKAYDSQATPLTKSSAAISITVSGATPVVSITSPVTGATFTEPASVTINASASEAGGTISKVEFYNGATLLGTSTTSPYTFTWASVAAGTYSLTAKAYDSKATPLTKTSTAVSITVNPVLPTVSITSPTTGATFTAPASVTINATAAEAGGTISKVEFYNGATLLGTSTTSPYTYTWTSVAAGTYSLTAKAYDSKTTPLTKTSAAVSITVNAAGGTCTAQQWLAASAYSTGAIVKQGTIKYVANWWTQGSDPVTNNGPTGSGQPWTSQGTCTSRVGDNEAALAAAVALSPNPADQNVSIALTLVTADEVSIEIYDVLGNKVADIQKGSLDAGNHDFHLNIGSYTSGTYIVHIIGTHIRKSVKFIKK